MGHSLFTPPKNLHPRATLLGLALLALLSTLVMAQDDEEGHGPPPLAIGSQAPDFCLPGVDSQTHCLKDYATAKVLMIAFICNHCPTSQLYETRLKQIAEDYKDSGVAVVAIEPNNPNAVRLDEMGYTDLGDSFEEMKIRAEYRHFQLPVSLRRRRPEDLELIRAERDSARLRLRRRPQAALRRAHRQ